MWKEQYRKTVIPIQLVIFTITLIACFAARLPILTVLFYFVIMQICAVIGAMWAARLRRKIEMSKKPRNKLPESLF
jgi:uncharacterized protein involved in cysteine biosynthesis